MLMATAACTIVISTSQQPPPAILRLPAPEPQPLREIITGSVPADVIPASFKNPPIEFKIEPASDAEVQRARNGLEWHINRRYPSGFVERQLKAIVMCKHISIFGVAGGGTHTPSGVFICTEDPDLLFYRLPEMATIFDHEFSTILYRKYIELFAHDEWHAALPAGFRYGSGGVDAVYKEKATLDPSRTAMERGFVCEYSLADVEEDVSTLAELMISHPTDAEAWAREWKALRVKLQILRRFYVRLDPRFDEILPCFDEPNDAPASRK